MKLTEKYQFNAWPVLVALVVTCSAVLVLGMWFPTSDAVDSLRKALVSVGVIYFTAYFLLTIRKYERDRKDVANLARELRGEQARRRLRKETYADGYADGLSSAEQLVVDRVEELKQR